MFPLTSSACRVDSLSTIVPHHGVTWFVEASTVVFEDEGDTVYKESFLCYAPERVLVCSKYCTTVQFRNDRRV